MTFWCRIKQSHLRSLSYHFKRCYVQIHGPRLLNYTASNTRNSVLDNPSGIYSRSQFDVFTNNVRFFAAPFNKAKPKEKEKEKEPTEPRMNEKITEEVVRLVTEEGGNDILPFNEALQRAKTLKLDLVEVDRKAVPPVCRMMDYNREQYKKLLAKKERAKGKTGVGLRSGVPVKEVRFKTKVEGKDLQFKVDAAIKLMEKGYRVKCYVTGKENEDIAATLSRVCALIEDTCIVESGPTVDKLVAYVVVRHAKFGSTKKGLNVSKIVVPPRVYEPKTDKKDKMDKHERRAARALEKSIRDDDEANKTYEVDESNEDSDFVNEARRVSALPPIENLAIVPPPLPSKENRYKKNPQTNQINNNDTSSGPHRYKKVPDASPPRGSNFQGNQRPDADRYGGVQSDNSTSVPNRYADNRPGVNRSDNSSAPPNRYAPISRPGGAHSDNSSSPPNRYAPTSRPVGAYPDNSAAPPNRYAPTSRPGGANTAAPPNRYAPASGPSGLHSDNSAAPRNRYAPTSSPGGAHSDNSTVPPNRYAERRPDVRR